MTEMKSYDNRYPVNSFRLCIDGVNGDVYGEIHSPVKREPIPFYGTWDVLLKMDELFDRIGYPQAFQMRRTFGIQKIENLYKGIPEPVLNSRQVRRFKGKIGTYDIRVDSRRDSSWQGVVLNIDHDLVGSFQGDMDLVALFDNMK